MSRYIEQAGIIPTKNEILQICTMQSTRKLNRHKNNPKYFLFILGSPSQQECNPVGCVPLACCPYLPACTAPGGCVPGLGVYLVPGGGVPGPRGCTWSRGYLVQGVYLVPGWCTCPGTPPREQNHRRLWKYNLAPTSLRAVKTLSILCRLL